MKTSPSVPEYASVDTTNVLSSHFMTVDMHRFALMWLVYSRNKFFRVGPNISEKFVPGGTNFRGVQIKCDTLRRERKVWSYCNYTGSCCKPHSLQREEGSGHTATIQGHVASHTLRRERKGLVTLQLYWVS